MVSPTHTGLSGHCSVLEEAQDGVAFGFSGGVEGRWCSCSVFCFFFIISFFIDTLHVCTKVTPVIIIPTSPECALAGGSK